VWFRLCPPWDHQRFMNFESGAFSHSATFPRTELCQNSASQQVCLGTRESKP
jgi:hypothetical protein